MCIRNKMTSLLYKAGLVLVSALGLLFSSTLLRDMSIFSYYTFLCVALCLLYYLFVGASLAVDIAKRGKRGAPLIANHFKGAVIVGLFANTLLYLFVMQPSGGQGALALVGDILVHFVVPLLALLDWALFDPKGRFYPSDPVVWLLIPYFYYAYVLVRAQIDALYFDGLRYSYPYAFINANSIGWTQVFVNVGLLSLIFLAMGYLLFAADRILGLALKRSAPQLPAEAEAEEPRPALRDEEATGATDAFTTSTIVAAMGARRDEEMPAGRDGEEDEYGALPFHPIGRFGNAITPEEVDAIEAAYQDEAQSFAPAFAAASPQGASPLAAFFEKQPQDEPLYAAAPLEEFQPQAGPLYAEAFSEDFHPQAEPLYAAASPEDFQPQAEPLYAAASPEDFHPQAEPLYATASPEDLQPQAEPLYAEVPRTEFFASLFADSPVTPFPQETRAALPQEEPIQITAGRLHFDYVPQPYGLSYAAFAAYTPPVADTVPARNSAAPYVVPVYHSAARPQSALVPTAQYELPSGENPGQPRSFYQAPSAYEVYLQQTQEPPENEARSFYQVPEYQVPGADAEQAGENFAPQDAYPAQEAVYEPSAEAYAQPVYEAAEPVYETAEPVYEAEQAGAYVPEQGAVVVPSGAYYQPAAEPEPSFYPPFGFEPQQDDLAVPQMQDYTPYDAEAYAQPDPYAQYVDTYLQQPPVYPEYETQPEAYPPQEAAEPQPLQEAFYPQPGYEEGPSPEDTPQEAYAFQQDAYLQQPSMYDVPPQQEAFYQPGYEAAPVPEGTQQQDAYAPQEPVYEPYSLQPEYHDVEPQQDDVPGALQPEEQAVTTLPEEQSISYDPSPEAYYETPRLAVNNSQSSIKGYVVPAERDEKPKGGKSMIVSGFRSPIPRTRRSQKNNNAANK